MAIATTLLNDDDAMPTASEYPPQDAFASQDGDDNDGGDDDDDVSVNVGDLGTVDDLDNDYDDAGRQQYTALPSGPDDDDFTASDDPVVHAHRSQFTSALAQLPRKADEDEDDDDRVTISTTSAGYNYFYESPTTSPTATASSALVTIGPAPKGTGYSSSYGPYRRGNATRNAFTGLSNQGATCYMNSLLQTMFMTPELRLGLYRWKYEDHADETSADADENIPYQLQKLFAKLQTTTQESISTKALTKSFGWTGADVFQQHDVQELNRVLFDALEKSFKGTINETLVNDLYQGTMKDYVQCRACGYESSRQDEFLDLSLVIRPFGSTQMMKSVEEAIEFFLKPEVLNGDNQWMCDRCETKRDAIKGLKFSKLPYLLSLQLKRFDYDYMTDSRVKLHDQVTFPKFLNMNTYVHDSEGGGARGRIARKMSMERHELETPRDADRLRRLSSMDETNPVVAAFPGQDELNMAPSEIADTWAPGFDVDALIDQSGPWVYELYSVLIHSGSALGGHYYAYIKSFESDKWFDFNDSSVSELSESEVKKAWGGSGIGGGGGGGGYGGRISYSTCAYMLMYRLVSRERNINSAPKESIPDYLTERMREDEERHRRQELERIELTKKMLIKFYMKSNSKNKIEKSIHVYKTATLTEALALAHGEFAKVLGDAMPSLENTRIRLYNDYTGLLSETYEGKEDKTLSELKMYSSYQLYLDVKKDGEAWDAYEPRKLQLYIRRFTLPHEATPVGPDMSARYVQLPDDATVESLLRVITAKFDIPATRKVRLVRKMATSYTSTPIKVLNRDESPETLGARLRMDHHLTNGNELFYEECDDLSQPSVAEEHFEREVNVIEINVWHDERLAESIRIDRRETVLALKQKIADKIGLPVDKFKVLRGNHHAGIEIKSIESTLFNLSMSSGHSVYALEGTPLAMGEYLFRLMLCKPAASVSASSSVDEPTLTVTSAANGEKDLFDLDEVMIRTNQEEATLEYITNIKVGEDKQVEDIRRNVWEVLKEKHKIPADGSITPAHIRLRDVQSTTLTRILVDGCGLRDASSSPVYEGRGMVAQILPEPETAQLGHRLVQVVYVDRGKWRFCKRRRFELVIPKEHVGEDPSTDDEEDDSYMNAGSMSLALTTGSHHSKRSTAASTALVSTWIPEQIALRLTIPPEQARFAVFPLDRDTFDMIELYKTTFDTWDRCLGELRDRQYNYQLVVFVADADVPVGGFSARERMHVQDFITKKRDEHARASDRPYSSYSSTYRKPKEAALVIRTKASKSSDKKGGSTASSNGGKNGVSIRTPTSRRVGSDTDEDEDLYGGVSLFDGLA